MKITDGPRSETDADEAAVNGEPSDLECQLVREVVNRLPYRTFDITWPHTRLGDAA